MSRFLIVPLFTAQRCQEIVAELRGADGEAATVYGKERAGSVEPRMRRATRLRPSEITEASVTAALEGVKDQLAAFFGIALTRCEEPQFLRYQAGDYFVAHQDGNTPLIHDDSLHRRVSVSVFLSRPEDDYTGGALVFHNPTETAEAGQGTLLAFRSETTHEVTPITAGERYSIVTWYR